MKKRLLVLLAAVMAVAICGSPLLAAEEKAAPEPKYLSQTVAKLDGGASVTLKSLLKKDKTVLVFFQTACSACRGEMSYFSEIYAKNPNIDIVGVSVDIKPEMAKKYKETNNIPFEIVSDPDFSVPGAFDFSSTPCAVVLDKGGNVLQKYLGFNAKVKDIINADLK